MGLKGIQQQRTISDAFDQSETGGSLIDLMRLDLLVGSGGALSHAPRRVQSALMMIDAFLPEGVTRLAVDSIFMMPQLGVLATVHEKAATEVFDKDCLIRLGTCIAPIGRGKEGNLAMKVSMNGETHEVMVGDMKLIPLAIGEKVQVEIEPGKGQDIGMGKGKKLSATAEGGVAGIVLDGRGRRPFQLPEDREKRIRKLNEWFSILDIYPYL